MQTPGLSGTSILNPRQQQVRAQTKTHKPGYDEAVTTFEQDAEWIRALDSDTSEIGRRSASSGESVKPFIPFSKVDTDPRKGEVEVFGAGSLHSTPEGYSLRVIGKNAPGQLPLRNGSTAHDERTYQVNESGGTITVVNSHSPSMHPANGDVSFRESYTIDTKNKVVTGYKKAPTGGPLASAALLGAHLGFEGKQIEGLPTAQGAGPMPAS